MLKHLTITFQSDIYLCMVWMEFILVLQKVIQTFHEDSAPYHTSLFSRFPSSLRMDVLPCVEDTGVVKNILACVLSALKTSGKPNHGLAFVNHLMPSYFMDPIHGQPF